MTNTDVFRATELNASNFTSNNSTVINTNLVGGDGPIGFMRYGSMTTGVPSNIFAVNYRVDAGKAAVVFNANLTSFGVSNVSYSSGSGTVKSDADQVSYSVDAALWLRLLLGKIALELAHKKLDFMRKDFDDWKATTEGADYPEGTA
ncbi:hypothetical protein [Paraburkholderia antibiotica]|uniref:hypothetical protein n=1 Tax=Paraburkholderia antibiotica TaxID=2728839 RepID=UPI001E6010AE|nr:hypothetical protein [Paraburkholderia antibiotica]